VSARRSRCGAARRTRPSSSSACTSASGIELTWLNAAANYFNLMAAPLGLESDGLEELASRQAG
jgi:hypothetical protein